MQGGSQRRGEAAMAGAAIGVVGLGGMGGGMAGRLLDTGHAVAVFNRTASVAAPFVARGATQAATPAEAAAGGIVITMVANDAALEQMAGGEAGILAGLPKGGVHVSMSTISVALARSLAERHAAAGSHFVGAPVFGRPDAAASGKLWILLSGAAEAKAKVRPVLEALSQAIEDLGEAADAAPLGKICGNFLIGVASEAMGEAFALLAKGGVDARAWHRLLTSGLFAGTIYTNYGRFILDRKFSPPGFKLSLGAKDIGLAMAASQELAVPMPFASVLRDRHLASIAQGRGDLDWTSLAINAAMDAGLKE
jgi:3-hydroxyisobutyrate dehydrogenase-like beta-hydroxyacid dehydrogenase